LNRRVRLRLPSPAKTVLILALLLIAAAIGSVFYAVKQISSPARRPLMDYHREILDAPADHGMEIQSFILGEGGFTPVIVCTPDASGKTGRRGIILREQLASRGVSLKPPGEIIGNLVLLHGRIGRKEDWLPVAERFCAVGFRCILPDLPGHGESDIPYTTYGVLNGDIPRLSLQAAAEAYHFDPMPAAIVGRSMGGSFATHSASLPHADWNAIAIVCSFDDFQPVIQSEASRYVTPLLAPAWTSAIDYLYERKTHVSLSAIHPSKKAADITIPALVAHGTKDPTIPLASGRKLFEAFASTDKRFIEIPGADHDNVFITDYPIYADIAEWMLFHLQR
jgi:pimeloyl-ACP methyl ester carboxylesterase